MDNAVKGNRIYFIFKKDFRNGFYTIGNSADVHGYGKQVYQEPSNSQCYDLGKKSYIPRGDNQEGMGTGNTESVHTGSCEGI